MSRERFQPAIPIQGHKICKPREIVYPLSSINKSTDAMVHGLSVSSGGKESWFLRKPNRHPEPDESNPSFDIFSFYDQFSYSPIYNEVSHWTSSPEVPNHNFILHFSFVPFLQHFPPGSSSLILSPKKY